MLSELSKSHRSCPPPLQLQVSWCPLDLTSGQQWSVVVVVGHLNQPEPPPSSIRRYVFTCQLLLLSWSVQWSLGRLEPLRVDGQRELEPLIVLVNTNTFELKKQDNIIQYPCPLSPSTWSKTCTHVVARRKLLEPSQAQQPSKSERASQLAMQPRAVSCFAFY